MDDWVCSLLLLLLLLLLPLLMFNRAQNKRMEFQIGWVWLADWLAGWLVRDSCGCMYGSLITNEEDDGRRAILFGSIRYLVYFLYDMT